MRHLPWDFPQKDLMRNTVRTEMLYFQTSVSVTKVFVDLLYVRAGVHALLI